MRISDWSSDVCSSDLLFDEVHERSLDSDFGLALALDAQAALRPDLRLIAMSATLDGARFAALMRDCPVIESEGRDHPLDLRYKTGSESWRERVCQDAYISMVAVSFNNKIRLIRRLNPNDL